MRVLVPLSLIALVAMAGAPAAAPLTADEAVKIALVHSTRAVQAEASMLDARSSLWSAYSGVLPSLSADYSRTGTLTKNGTGSQVFGSVIIPSTPSDRESYSNSPTISGRMNVLNLSTINGLRGARAGMKAAELSRTATRNDIVLGVKTQFYEVVKAVHLAEVQSGALKLARDDERRVRALYEVGSVAKSDLLNAQVATAQSELDSLLANHAVTQQRIGLAEAMGIHENDLGDVDTTLAMEPHTWDEAQVLADAKAARPDLQAADRSLSAAIMDLNAARWSRLPYLTATGSITFNPSSSTKVTSFLRDSTTGQPFTDVAVGNSKSDRQYGGTLALNWDFFDGLATDGRIAAARSRVLTARETRDALVRNLESEVHQALLGDQEAVERQRLAHRSLESASENLNLIQQKYNVGSATILDLINAQVQLQKAQSDLVTALAAIRDAEATLDHVRGRGE